jgi:non-specific serine/threonine protein kinase
LRPAIEGPSAGATLARLEREHLNFRAALAFSIDEDDADRSVRLVAALWKFWYVHRHISELRSWSDRVLHLPGGAPADLRAEVLYAAGSVAAYQGDFARGEQLSQECLALARAKSDRLHAGMALFALGTIARNQGRFDEAEAMYQEALAFTTAVSGESSFGDHMCAMIASSLGDMVFEKGDFPQAMALFDEAFAIWQRRGDAWGMAIALHNLAAVSLANGDLNLAAHRFRQSLSFYRDLGDEVGFSHSMTGLGIVAIRMGHAESAARLMGTSHEIRAKEDIPIVRMMQADYDQALNQGRRAIGAERFDLAWEGGRSASLAQAFEDATTLSLTTPPVRSAETPYGLTARELDVLRLIADGKSDQEIADKLFISYRTVTTHVANIRGKLSVTSRTAAGAMAHRLGIV